MGNFIQSITDFNLFGTPAWRYVILFFIIVLFLHAWNGVLDHIK